MQAVHQGDAVADGALTQAPVQGQMWCDVTAKGGGCSAHGLRPFDQQQTGLDNQPLRVKGSFIRPARISTDGVRR